MLHLFKCRLLNKIKEYTHNKIKGKQIKKFNHLLRKSNGYYHYFGTFNRHVLFGRHPYSNVNVQGTMLVSSAKTTTAPTTLTAQATISTTSSTHSSCKKNKWVMNLCNTPLNPAQESLLPTEPNFTIVPKYPPKESYITVVKEACTSLLPREAEELKRVESGQLLRNNCSLPNLISHHRSIKPSKNLRMTIPGGTHSRQGGSHGCYGQGRLYRQGHLFTKVYPTSAVPPKVLWPSPNIQVGIPP